MIEKVIAYKSQTGGPLETDPKRAYAWLIANKSEEDVSFTGALWILSNVEFVRNILKEYETEVQNYDL